VAGFHDFETCGPVYEGRRCGGGGEGVWDWWCGGEARGDGVHTVRILVGGENARWRRRLPMKRTGKGEVVVAGELAHARMKFAVIDKAAGFVDYEEGEDNPM
jgi:hypothetical protein